MLILGNEDFDLLPQLAIFAAGLIEKRSTRFGDPLQRGGEQFLCSVPTFLLHS